MQEQRHNDDTQQALGARVAHRYDCLELLGSGGNASVRAGASGDLTLTQSMTRTRHSSG